MLYTFRSEKDGFEVQIRMRQKTGNKNPDHLIYTQQLVSLLVIL